MPPPARGQHSLRGATPEEEGEVDEDGVVELSVVEEKVEGIWGRMPSVHVADLEVTVTGDAIKSKDVVSQKRNGDYFLRHIAKQNTLMEDLAPARALVYKGKLPGQTAA